MKKTISTISLFVLLSLLALLCVLQYKVIKKTGKYDLDILKTDVEVYVDKFGIPHIDGENAQDVYRVLGFMTAGERLFQMDLLRRLVNGRLSEIFGERSLNADILLRKLRFKKNAQNFLKQSKVKLSPELLSHMNAFLEGVHYYIENNPLPLEFDLLGYTPDKFDISDILGISGYMALTFAQGLTGDILNSELMETLSEEKSKIIRSGSDVDYQYFSKQKLVKTNFLKELHRSVEEISEFVPLFHGSNSWVLSGDRTTSGKPILANDPHIATSSPHIFFEAHIKYPHFELYGHYIPLLPFPVIGHTPDSAWAITMAVFDDLTVYLEKFNPQDKNQIMYNNEWVDIERSVEIIKVKGAKDRRIETILTPHGPLLDGTKFSVEGKSLSLNWSVYHPENNMLQSLYLLPRAKTVDDFKEAVSHAAAPGLNVSWVNTSGDIAWWVLGKFPKLPVGVSSDVVLRGWDGSQEVERYYTIDENPHQVNPENGIIISANYKPQMVEYDHFNGHWQPGGRYFRLENLLSNKEKWSVEELKKIQTDNIVPGYKKIKEHILEGINKEELSVFELKVLKAYAAWEGTVDKRSVGASIYHMWNYQISHNIFIDELGLENFEKFGRTVNYWQSFKKLLSDQSHSFWDNITTNHVESGQDVITLSFKQAVRKLGKKLGKRIDRWDWGKLHTVEYTHALGKKKPLNLLYNIGPIQASGARYVINNHGHKKYTDDFRVVHGPATRRLIDMSNPRKSFGIIPTGNSGNPFSEHFSDQLKLFHEGKYRLQNMDWELIRKQPLLLFRANE